MSYHQGTVVIGAGVIGLSIALRLVRSDVDVTIVDPLPPGGRASFGNAGIVNPDTVMPMSGPGTLEKVPRWLFDPKGPLSIPPGYFLKALPWLLKYIRAGTPAQVRRIAEGMHQLHHNCAEEWEDLTGSSFFSDNFAFRGALQLGLGGNNARAQRLGAEIRDRFGVSAEQVDGQRLRELAPDVTERIKGGLLLHKGGYTKDPAALCQHLAEQFQKAGGRILNRSVESIERVSTGHISLVTNHHGIDCARVIVAAGVWSGALVRHLGIHLPMEAERGYHALLPAHNLRLNRSISFKDRGFSVSPMTSGLRIAGTVEFSGLHRAPEMSRARRLVDHAHELFPDLEHGTPSFWAGYRPSMPDSLPVISAVTDERDIIFAFGHNHYGMSGAPGTARIVSDMVLGNGNADVAAFRHDRFTSRRRTQ